MEIHSAGSRPTRRAPKESFTGTVWQDPIITPQAPARVASARVACRSGEVRMTPLRANLSR